MVKEHWQNIHPTITEHPLNRKGCHGGGGGGRGRGRGRRKRRIGSKK